MEVTVVFIRGQIGVIRFERKKGKIGNLFFSEMNRVNLNITAFPVDIGKPGLSVSEIM